MTRPKTKLLEDGGDPQETRQVKELLGFVDGQTTNPSLIAKNPHIKELIASGHCSQKNLRWENFRWTALGSEDLKEENLVITPTAFVSVPR
ncbi:MAG TPA: hypothetical protein VFV92_01650 [Candidatus Bathyarchaeia archaeon]|nr:hypothetical protein [Candidatus Bathyarchaeia archaeon]